MSNGIFLNIAGWVMLLLGYDTVDPRSKLLYTVLAMFLFIASLISVNTKK